jgi:hypothetical protein
VPEGVLPVGLTQNNEEIYMGRVEHEGFLIPGRVSKPLSVFYLAEHKTKI